MGTRLLTDLGIAFQMVDVGGEFGGNRTPEYLRLNPHGVVPALIDADTPVWESNTILRYIAHSFVPTPFYPSHPAARADCECWMDGHLGTLNPCMTKLSLGRSDARRLRQEYYSTWRYRR